MASTNFINECKTPAYEDRLGKLVIDGVEYNQGNYLSSMELENNIYNNGTIIGNTYTKSLKFSLINVDKDTQFVSKKATPSVGVKYSNNTTEYIDFDDYTIETLNDEQTKNFTDILGYDSLNTMDKTYVYGLSDGPHTVAEYWQDLLNNLGLETETPYFTNSDIVIPANPFVNNEANSVVLGEIEKVSCTFSKIEKRTRTVNNQQETYHVINLTWFNDDKGETTTVDGGGTINNVDRIDKVSLLGKIQQDGTPTPTSPVEIKTVTGRQVVDVSNGQMLHETNQGVLHWGLSNGNGEGAISSKYFDDVPTTNNQYGIIYNKTTTSSNWQLLYFNDNDFKQTLFDSVEGTKYTISFDIRVDVDTNNSLDVSFKNTNSQNTLIGFGAYRDGLVANQWKHIEMTGIRNDSTTLSSQVLYFNTYNIQRDVNSIEIVNVKIELGEIATKYGKLIENEINLGKNLFDISLWDNVSLSVGGGSGTVEVDDNSVKINNTGGGDVYTISGMTVTGQTISSAQRKYLMKVKPNTSYTISFIKTSDDFSTVGSDSCFYSLEDKNYVVTSYANFGNFGFNNTVSKTITTSNDTKYLSIRFGVRQAVGTITYSNIMVEEGPVATNYSSYKTPTELCEIQTYKDFIDRTTGKNLFDKSTAQKGYYYQNSSIGESGNWYIQQVPVKPNTSYYLSGNNYNNTNARIVLLNRNNEIISAVGNYVETHSITTTATTAYIGLSIADYNGTADFDYIQLEEGSQATQFEPFGNNKWYIHKEIDKVVYNGSESWTFGQQVGETYLARTTMTFTLENNSNKYKTDYFTTATAGWATSTIGSYVFNNEIRFRVPSTIASSTQTYKTWLETNNVSVYYVLDTPTNTIIEDEELISQLNNIRLVSGKTYISLRGDIAPSLKVSYFGNTPNYEFATSDYSDLEGSLTEYGPVNCVTLGNPDIGGENVFRKDEESIEENGETNVVINAEYFLYTQALRQQAIVAIYNKLLNFRYYDLSLTTYYGKPFLQVGDKIRVNTNEGNVYDTYILKHTFTYDGTFKSVIESPSFTKQEEIVKSTESISSKIKRTEIMVDKANGQISYITQKTNELEQNTYTIEETNTLVQEASGGLTNTFSKAGGNNIFRNTGLWFENTGDDSQQNPYEFWSGVVVRQREENASNLNALYLQNGNLIQEQEVPNGDYTVSFVYKKLSLSANATVYINDTQYLLTGNDETEFLQVIKVNSKHINVKFVCDINNGFEIYDLMVNAGSVKLAYSQNQNETTTDTVNISKGITITSSDTKTTFKANSTGIKTLDESGNRLTEFTDTGMVTKEAIIENKSQIVGTLWQEVGDQTWITKL